MAKALGIHETTVGLKAIMAVTGVALIGFLVGHLAGNLPILLAAGAEPGSEAVAKAADGLNEYATFLRRMGHGGVIWVLRRGLIAVAIAHIAAALALTRRNRAARPVGYRRQKDQVTSFAARTMIVSGPIVLFYFLFHLAHLTLGVAGFDYVHGHVYNSVVAGFKHPVVLLLYIIGNGLLALHLWRGAWSFLQSLGASHVRYDALRYKLAAGIALLIGGGNIAIPIVVFAAVPFDTRPESQIVCHPEIAPNHDCSPGWLTGHGASTGDDHAGHAH